MKTKKKIKELEARIEKLEKPNPSGELVFTPLFMLQGKALKDIIEKGCFSDIKMPKRVADFNGLVNINPLVRWEGLTVFVESVKRHYVLLGGIDNSNWTLVNRVKDHEKVTERLYTIEGFAKIANIILTPDLHNDIYLSLLDSVGPTECLIDDVWTGEALSKAFNEIIFNPKTQNIVDYLYSKGITLKTKLEDEIALKCLEHVGTDTKMPLEDVKKYCQFRYSIIDKALKYVLFGSNGKI